ncbi:uncharacterized protein METZ01_LOCUS154450 [marine metagenome]|uniref:Uncharacterized protein n=1 Tax=marine metagenome TaxID=408172 RepID=A0A382AJA7_9ZZZZ
MLIAVDKARPQPIQMNQSNGIKVIPSVICMIGKPEKT